MQNFKYESEPHGENHYLWGGGLRALSVYSILTELLCLFMIGLAIAYKSMLIFIEDDFNKAINLYHEETAGSHHEETAGSHHEEIAGSPEHRRLSSGGPQMAPFASEILFSTSLAIILAIIVVMSYSHIGFKKMIFPIRYGRLHYSSLLRLSIQLGLILFVGTMFLWDIKAITEDADEPEYFLKYIIGFVVIVIFAGIKTVENLIATKKSTEKIIANLQTFGTLQHYTPSPSNNDDDDNVGSPFSTNNKDDDLQLSTQEEASKRKSDDNKDSADDNCSINDLEQERRDHLQRVEHISHLIDIRKDSARVEE